MGCACIGTAIPGNTEIIGHEQNGLLTAVANVEEMACALDRLIRDEPLRRTFQECARESVMKKGMTAANMTECYAQLYDSLL